MKWSGLSHHSTPEAQQVQMHVSRAQTDALGPPEWAAHTGRVPLTLLPRKPARSPQTKSTKEGQVQIKL